MRPAFCSTTLSTAALLLVGALAGPPPGAAQSFTTTIEVPAGLPDAEMDRFAAELLQTPAFRAQTEALRASALSPNQKVIKGFGARIDKMDGADNAKNVAIGSTYNYPTEAGETKLISAGFLGTLQYDHEEEYEDASGDGYGDIDVIPLNNKYKGNVFYYAVEFGSGNLERLSKEKIVIPKGGGMAGLYKSWIVEQTGPGNQYFGFTFTQLKQNKMVPDEAEFGNVSGAFRWDDEPLESALGSLLLLDAAVDALLDRSARRR